MNLLELRRKVKAFEKEYNTTTILHGGSALLAYGIRETCGDIDLIVTEEVFKKIKKENNLTPVSHRTFTTMRFGDFDLSYYGLAGYTVKKSGLRVYDLATLALQKARLWNQRKLDKDLVDFKNLLDVASKHIRSKEDRRRLDNAYTAIRFRNINHAQ